MISGANWGTGRLHGGLSVGLREKNKRRGDRNSNS